MEIVRKVPNLPESAESPASSLTLERSSGKLLQCLVLMQVDYGTSLPKEEVKRWHQVLVRYPLEDVIAAMEQIRFNPVNGWTGMPRLVDIERLAHELGETARRNAEQAKAEREERELQERRRKHPEQFIGWADVLKDVRDSGIVEKSNLQQSRARCQLGSVKATAAAAEMTDAQLADRREMLKQQAQRIIPNLEEVRKSPEYLETVRKMREFVEHESTKPAM